MTPPLPNLHPTLETLVQPYLSHRPELDCSSPAQLNLIESGLMDSLQFLEFLAHLQEECDVAFDLFDVDPNRLTTLEGLNELLLQHHDPNE